MTRFSTMNQIDDDPVTSKQHELRYLYDSS
jgi:hypothetical protein